MTAPIIVPANEHGVVRVLQLSPRLVAMIDHAETLAPLEQTIGSGSLSADHVQIVSLAQLDDLGLAGLLEQGHGIAPASLAQDRKRLDDLTGTVAILRSGAFGGRATTLTPSADCTLIAGFTEDAGPSARFEPLPSGGAKGILPGGRAGEYDSAHRASRRTLLMGLVAVALVGLVLFLISGQTG